MKKLVYVFVALLSMGVSIVSCDDDDNDVMTFATTAEKDFIDTVRYTGLLTRVEKGKELIDTADAEVSVVATDSAYVVDMIFHCFDATFKIDSVKGPVNIVRANEGYAFQNNSTTNLFGGNPFSGRISPEKEMDVKFVMKIRSGRQTKTYNFQFVGSKK